MKLPTARTGIGNVERGVAAPINYRPIDVGINIGLNRNTPDVVSYIGISTRFCRDCHAPAQPRSHPTPSRRSLGLNEDSIP
jgi:hypothetical protein